MIPTAWAGMNVLSIRMIVLNSLDNNGKMEYANLPRYYMPFDMSTFLYVLSLWSTGTAEDPLPHRHLLSLSSGRAAIVETVTSILKLLLAGTRKTRLPDSGLLEPLLTLV